MNAWKKILKEWILPLGAEVLVIVFLLKVVFMLVLVPSGSNPEKQHLVLHLYS